MSPLTVGFDLDMTLVDSRPGIAAAYRALTARTGVPVDADAAVSRLGPPLRTEIARWFPPEQVESAVHLYRELYPAYAITPTVPLPGAREAIEAIRARGGRVLVVTSKLGRLARLHLDHLGLVVDEVAGDLFAEEKAVALRQHDATHYVGDHVADMVAAAAAEVPGIAVATGPCSADELRAAGAEVVLDDLTEFPAALDGMIQLALEQ
ncbi:HAD family hydrolase [Micromonospora sp. WMMD812]|uniref:HAD family hydrolase n=1 Tax=Micromonospora sp. WMMD812 TaxID=3015152 RepID=UPI00248AA36F|nr:HAD family hydrolase [Micromonospora sp. WMMD812]WBB65330.1 HAD family hydrolase [Micromonospora sp. WMMD812]